MKKIVDLTYVLEDGMTTFAASWHPRFSVTQFGRIGFEGRETRNVSFGTHTGTHADAPKHFIKGGKSIDQVPLEKLVGPVSIIDFSHLKPNQAVTKQMLSKISVSKKMIFKFGWGKYWDSKEFYRNYPFFSPDAANYLVSKDVELIALDTPSPDDGRISLSGDVLGSAHDSPIHKIFLKNNVVLVEYLANLDKLTDYNDWSICVMPLRIKGADGSPARVCLFK